MMLSAPNYAKTLLKFQGKENALRIAENCLKVSSQTRNVIFFDEADFYISTEKSLASFELNKTQSKRVVGKKETRDKNLLNFWTEVVNIIKKG